MDSFLKGRERLTSPGISVKTTEKPVNEELEAAKATSDEEMPSVEFASDNGVVKKIVVTCTCGKCIELQCDYE